LPGFMVTGGGFDITSRERSAAGKRKGGVKKSPATRNRQPATGN
jgi:hypothetical protein